MTILALEFSSPLRSVAVLRLGRTPSEVVNEVAESGGRSTRALGMIEEALREAQIERERIDCIAVGLGPGSYTGVRAAIAIAQGWQLAREVRLLGISSAEAVAAAAQAQGLTGRLAVVVDAQRNEFYLANYELSAGDRREVQPLRLTTATEVKACSEAGWVVVGPEAPRWFAGARLITPQASELARLAAARTDFPPGEQLEPIYLRETKFVKAPAPRIVP